MLNLCVCLGKNKERIFMKKFFVLTISMLTLLCCVPLFACAGGATGDNGGLFGEGVEEKFVDTQYGITYTLQEDDTYAVTNYAQELELSEIVIKDVIEDKPVTSIAPQVFKNKGYNATSKKGIKTVVLPESLVSIGEQAFYECRVLSAINLENVQYIGARAFYNCGNIGCEQPNTIILTNEKLPKLNFSDEDICIINDIIRDFCESKIISYNIAYKIAASEVWKQNERLTWREIRKRDILDNEI